MWGEAEFVDLIFFFSLSFSDPNDFPWSGQRNNIYAIIREIGKI